MEYQKKLTYRLFPAGVLVPPLLFVLFLGSLLSCASHGANGAPGKMRIADLEGVDPVVQRALDKKDAEYTEDIRYLVLRSGRVQSLEALTQFPNLEALHLYFTKLPENQTRETLQPLTRMPSLKRLFLTGNDIQDAAELPPLPQLSRLDLNRNQLSDTEALAAYLKTLPRLTSLSLGHNDLDDPAPLQELTQLKTLDVSGLGITRIAWAAPLAELRHLNISYNKVQSLEAISGLRHLESLRISGNPIEDISLLTAFPELTVLQLDWMRKIEDLSPLRECPGLTVLTMKGVPVSDPSILPPLTSLESLSLERCGLTSTAPLAGMTRLRRLNLNRNPALAGEALDRAVQLHRDGAFSDSRRYQRIQLEQLGSDFSRDGAPQKLKQLQEAGIRVDYRLGNFPPPEDADTGKTAPPFNLIDQAGESVELKDLRGQYIFIQVSAEGCPYCHHQARNLAPFHQALQSRGAEEDFASVLFLQDRSELPKHQKNWDERYGFEYILIPGDSGGYPGTYLNGLPGNSLILPNGHLAAQWAGGYKEYDVFLTNLYSFIPEFFLDHQLEIPEEPAVPF